MSHFNYSTEEAMAQFAKAAADRFRNELRARILENLDAMVDEVVATIAKDMETRAYRKMDSMMDTVVVSYINRKTA